MYTNLPTSQGYIFRILQHFATKLCSFSNFDNFFPKISFVIPRLNIFLKRKSSIVMGFVKLLKRKANVPTNDLTGDELRLAEIDWIKSVQACSFRTEQNTLMKGGTACLHQFELRTA
jgi:hypothetical protein